MVITPTLETLRFIGARSTEMRAQAAHLSLPSRFWDQPLSENLLAQVYAQQFVELVAVLHDARQTPLALEVALSIPLPTLRYAALQYLGRIDQGDFELLREAFDTIKEIGSERERSQALVQLAGDLPLDLLPDAVALARQMTWGYGQVCVLQALAQQCVDPDDQQALLDEALAAAHQINDAEDAAEAILLLLPKLDWQRADDEIQTLLGLVRQITSEAIRTKLFLTVVEQVRMWLNTNRIPIHVVISRLNLLSTAVQETLSTQTYQNQVLHAMIPLAGGRDGIAWRIPESLLRQAIVELKITIQRGDWLQAIADLLPLLEINRLERQVAPSHTSAEDRSGLQNDPRPIIHIFATHIPLAVIPDVLSLVPYLPSHEDRAELLIGLIPRLAEHQLDGALALVYSLPEKVQCEVFIQIALTLPQPFVQRAIMHLKSLPTSSEQVDALTALAH